MVPGDKVIIDGEVAEVYSLANGTVTLELNGSFIELPESVLEPVDFETFMPDLDMLDDLCDDLEELF